MYESVDTDSLKESPMKPTTKIVKMLEKNWERSIRRYRQKEAGLGIDKVAEARDAGEKQALEAVLVMLDPENGQKIVTETWERSHAKAWKKDREQEAK